MHYYIVIPVLFLLPDLSIAVTFIPRLGKICRGSASKLHGPGTIAAMGEVAEPHRCQWFKKIWSGRIWSVHSGEGV